MDDVYSVSCFGYKKALCVVSRELSGDWLWRMVQWAPHPLLVIVAVLFNPHPKEGMNNEAEF